jgi:exopolysaccharide production protein ExoQ
MPTGNSDSALLQRGRWLLSFASLASLTFSNWAPTRAAALFLISAAVLGMINPQRALRATFGDWLPWMQIALAMLSLAWSAVPDLTTRYAIELTLTAAAALIIARSLTPRAFLSALLCAYVLVDVASVLVGRYAWNAGSLAMIGAFGSKNAFSATQAVCLLTSCWVLLSVNQPLLMRCLAFLGTLICPVFLIAGRSADAVAPVVLATSFTLLMFGTTWLPLRQRILTLSAGTVLIVVVFSIAFIFNDIIFGQLLVVTGKDVTLSGRTYLWARASDLMRESPLLGTGFGGFWVQGNPYAEELWLHFGLPGRGGFNFHNLWYEMGVELGYVGIASALVTLLVVSVRVVRWVVRQPSPEAMFFLGYVMIINMRSLLEVEILSQFSLPWVILLVAGYYARYATRNSTIVSTKTNAMDLLKVNAQST